MRTGIKGYASMRNEDGTQYLTEEGWSTYCKKEDRKVLTYGDFLTMMDGAEATRRNDSPDTGYLGVYDLVFHPVGDN